VRRTDVEHQATRGGGGGGGKEVSTGPRKAGALRGGSHELSSRERGGVAVVADVAPASAPMASTGSKGPRDQNLLDSLSQLVRQKSRGL
jgi:hypothetical protein